MTLKHVRPATINTTKLCAVVLFAIGIAVFAYPLADRGALRRLPIASTLAWTGGFVLLALERRKRRAPETSERLPAPPRRSHKTPA
jgi:hypothetical protein